MPWVTGVSGLVEDLRGWDATRRIAWLGIRVCLSPKESDIRHLLLRVSYDMLDSSIVERILTITPRMSLVMLPLFDPACCMFPAPWLHSFLTFPEKARFLQCGCLACLVGLENDDLCRLSKTVIEPLSEAVREWDAIGFCTDCGRYRLCICDRLTGFNEVEEE
ncbi:uncharacterized protein PHACADRAFT_33604 [Phanerochaete carnosa HHB-10118-sp]|uniref:Uncharacterized protein n=1 Tax=Phanerochaete carnosa (strain HHB-10118-sp) TaxID=650164 RepID=K5WG17_PHACS|nr:uncharacterized protein PHACADRAFT_33604 [Phanerochaete carnosa HHB-10118-sp]EKM49147.1 hypothetical protein PHACADRAFT_33604 [Phanerochaete carnosa HHB-10118-sp]